MKYFLYCRKSTEDEERQVLSLQSQQEAISRAFGGNDTIQIVETFEESKSAKTPGRLGFAAMIARIEAGEADGIVSWAPDRLARNSIDGGRIIYLLDTGALRDLKFATYTFENNSQGKFMLSIMFGQSKYYSDALSENVKRGNRTKLERGWRPNRAPLGYLNDSVTKTIIPDPVHFPLVRRMFEMILSQAYTPREIVRVAREDWGFLTPKYKKCGGTPIAASTIYKLLSNRFYMGLIEWNGSTYPGRHIPVISPVEFERVQMVLARRSTPHPRRFAFSYTGSIRCGTCGKMITAERKTNRYGSRYTYYHCAARSVARGGCRESSIEERDLDAQVRQFLSSLQVSAEVADWVRTELEQSRELDVNTRQREALSRQQAIGEIGLQIDELTSLRVRRLLDDAEYIERRKHLESNRDALQTVSDAPDRRMLIEPFDLLISASNRAVEWFATADDAGKRAILKITGSNPRLKSKILSIEAAKPFFNVRFLDGFPRQRGDVDVIRTLASPQSCTNISPLPALTKRQIHARGRALISELRKRCEGADGDEWVSDLRQLVLRHDPSFEVRVASRTRGRGSLRPALRPRRAALRERVRKRR